MTRHRHALAATGIAVALLATAATPALTQAPTPAGDGTIATLAGTTAGFAGDQGLSGDGGPATDADLDRPRGVTTLSGGGYLVADTFNGRVRKVAADGTITTVAGTDQGLSGDGGPATSARLSLPSDTAALPGGGFLIADTGNNRIRKVAADGTITTVAGTAQGFGGDGGPATSAQLNQPRDVAVASDGSILVADTGNNRIREITPGGTITTIAGAGGGLAGDGDPARTALLSAPFSVAALPHGGVLFADTGNNRVRRVTPLGAIFTVAGTSAGKSGDGALAKAAQLNQPGAVTIAPNGGFLVADTNNATVRRVSDVGAIPPAAPGHSFDVAPVATGTMVQPAGTTAFQPLLEKDLVPTGSQVNANDGKIAVTTAMDAAATQQTAQLYAGSFGVTQLNTPAQGLTTQFRLPPVTDCATATKRGVMAHAARKRKAKAKPKSKSKTAHGLWVTETGGHWRTATGSVSAAAIGTQWHTTLTCNGTRVGVHQGIVAVRDRIHQKTVVLHAGQTRLFATSSTLQGH